MDFDQMFAGKASSKQPQAYAAPAAGKKRSKDDEELAELLQESAPKIVVFGAGGSGSNTINRLAGIGVAGATLVAANTDAQHLLKIDADRKLVLGRKKTRGLGAGSNPTVGEAAAEESYEEVKQAVAGTDMVFITCGMGGGTGTGSAHVIARAAKEAGALTIGVVTMPFSSEGTKRKQNAITGVEKLKEHADTVIVIPNDKLLYYVPDLPLNAAFKAADMVLANAVKGITELITKPGLVNLDFADLRTVLTEAGTAVIGVGEIEGNEIADRVSQAASKAMTSPLLDIDVSTADRALINITGGVDLTLGEAEAAVKAVSDKIAPEAHIIWGANIDETIQSRGVRVLAVLAGIREMDEMGQGEAPLDLEFV